MIFRGLAGLTGIAESSLVSCNRGYVKTKYPAKHTGSGLTFKLNLLPIAGMNRDLKRDRQTRCSPRIDISKSGYLLATGS
jgi:hypothetical protein